MIYSNSVNEVFSKTLVFSIKWLFTVKITTLCVHTEHPKLMTNAIDFLWRYGLTDALILEV